MRFLQKRFFEMRILHLSNAYQKLIKRRSKNMCENRNVLTKRKCFEVYTIGCEIYKNHFKY